MKLASRLVSGAVVLAMAGAVPAWADTAAQPAPAPPAGRNDKDARNAKPLHLAQAANAAARQTSGGQQAAALQEVVVNGIRQSMESALHIKEFADTIEDSVVASDIGKLPDVTAIDAIQRIPGVQISRQLGEGGGTVAIGGSVVDSGYEIRGLPQAETTLNGREVFSAQGSRVLNLEDIPSALLAGVDVYKDPTADQIAGGLAGTVDLRTHKPFDFNRLELEGSAEEQYGDLIGQAKPAFTGLASDTWNTGIGKIGALLTVSYQDRSYREDSATNNAVATSSTVIPGETITYPNGAYNTMFAGDRRRTGVDAVLQWQPTDDFQTWAEVSSEDFDWAQNQYTFTTTGTGDGIKGNAIRSASLFPGTTDAQTITFTNASAGTVGAWRTVEDVDRQFAVHAKWTPAPWTVEGDISYTKATERLNNPAVLIGALAPALTQVSSIAGVPESLVSGVNLNSLSSYGSATSYTYDTEQHFRGDEGAARLDVSYALPSGFVNSVQGGLRFADRKDAFNQWSNFGSISAARIQANPQWFGEVPLSPFFSATESNAVQPQYVVFNPNVLRYNLLGADRTFGIAPPVDNGSQDYHVDERAYAGYFRVNFGTDWAIPMTGNIGVRLVRHEDFMNGELTTAGLYTPNSFSLGETDALPSLNLNFKLRDDLQLRLGASKVVSYPDFTQISPSITLLPAQGTARGGNPNLKPTKASQVDASLEWYFAQGSALTADVFYKKLNDFILQETQQNAFTVGGVNYNLTGAIDGGDGTIKGVELGYQQFFRNLPGLLSGLGMEANYTYIEATAPTAVVGQTTTLPGLSKNSYNLIGIYEEGPVSFRLAYNWRSQFYTSIYNGATAQLASNPIFTKQYGWMDVSLEYNVNNWLALYAQGTNLLRTRITQFYGVPTLAQSFTIDDRQATLGFRVKFSDR